jgi:hypothetical protein
MCRTDASSDDFQPIEFPETTSEGMRWEIGIQLRRLTQGRVGRMEEDDQLRMPILVAATVTPPSLITPHLLIGFLPSQQCHHITSLPPSPLHGRLLSSQRHLTKLWSSLLNSNLALVSLLIPTYQPTIAVIVVKEKTGEGGLSINCTTSAKREEGATEELHVGVEHSSVSSSEEIKGRWGLD